MNPRCYLCSSPLRAELEKLLITVYRCPACSLLQIVPADYPPEIREFYSEPYFKRGKYVTDRAVLREQDRRLGMLRQSGLKSGARVLDVGCAVGDFVLAAKDQYEIWGCDVSEYAVSVAKERIPDRAKALRSGFLDELRYDAGMFDALTAWDVVEHLTDPAPVLAEMKRILKPGGLLFLSTPNSGAATAKILKSHWAFMTPPEHVFYFSKKTLAELLQKSGFELGGWMTKGKWANAGFLSHKLARMFPGKLSAKTADLIKSSGMANVIVYVPTGDVQYLWARAI